MKRWVVLLVLSLVLLLGVPLAWRLSRPDTSAGLPLDQALPVSTSLAASAGPGLEAPALVEDQTVATRPATIPGPIDSTSPLRLRIVSVDIDAAIDAVGVEEDGSMVIPREADRVGWYQYGPLPGSAQGAAVIAGHVDSRTQGRGALFRLRDISIDDIIEVDTGNGATLNYRVTSKEQIVKEALPTERLFTREGAPRLVLITCGGPFNQALRSYQDNLIVLAEPLP
jgi:hypothetical protein